MKSSLKRILPILLAILVLCSIIWYLFIYDRDFTRDMLLWQARLFENNGNHAVAAWFYEKAYQQSCDSQYVAIELAEQFKNAGNYTKAESTLSNAIATQPSVELYIALSKTYIEQDKLLDAVNMLENVTDPEIKAQLEAMRPSVPTVSEVPGFYNQYIQVDVMAETGVLYVSTDLDFPSIEEDLYKSPITLSSGENKIYALAVSEEGIVSPLGVFGYTVGGVVEPVTFVDSTLETCIRDLLGYSSAHIILTSDLWPIAEFTVPKGVTDLTDLQYMTGLKKLTIEDAYISDLTCLSAMTRLTSLTLRNCNLSSEDLNAISSHTKLTELTISGCSVSSVAFLSNLRNLTYLDLSRNTIRDISHLSFMTELQELDLSQNAITSLNAISGLKKLTRLNLSNNSLSSLVPLRDCTAIVWLNVSNNSIASLDGLQGMAQLASLYAAYNTLTEIDDIGQNSLLSELDVSNNSLTQITSVASLKDLMFLDFSYNEVTILPEFDKACILVLINGSYNQLTNLVPLARLPMLNRVIMDYNNISKVAPLATCYNLIQVDIYGNPVNDISALTEMDVIVNYSPDI